jgi:hypothetical protein
MSYCVLCTKQYNVEYYQKRCEEIKLKQRAYSKLYWVTHKDRKMTYRKNNKEKLQVYMAEYHKDYDIVYQNRRFSTDIKYKLAKTLRSRVNKAIVLSSKSGSAVRDLGCSIEFLKCYLESKFKTGMTWDNWSQQGWHIDHIMPLSKFDLTNPEQFLQACHYTNLQPLWAKENLSKGNR